MRPIASIFALLAVLSLSLAATAGAATSGSFDDPIGDSLEFAPDLGVTTVTVGDDDTIVLNTRIVPRPPANWGGCAYVVGSFPFETCVPADMNVTWYFDYSPSSGSVADGGADAKVTVIPSRGQTFWESSRWDSANGKFSAGAKPAGAEDPGGVTWTLRLGDLGIPKPATLRVWAVSLYKSYNGVGQLLNHSDTAGPGAISVPGAPNTGVSVAKGKACKRAIGKANSLQRRIRVAKRGKAAQRRIRKLRGKRKRALMAAQQRCGAEVDPSQSPPSAAPPGCRLVTKPVLQQDGPGIYAPWVIKPEVVVECRQS